MDRGGPWDELISQKLEQLFGFEKFDPEKVSLSFEEKRKIFLEFVRKIKSKNIKVIIVAGTNGKGETSRLLHSHFRKAGKKVALWTSPHILSVRERFICNEDLISEREFENCLERIDVSGLSYYEGLFLYFCDWASKKDLDLIILEVGLGGRLDSTNYFDADLVCLTSISRDHCELLGNSLKAILREKLGVCRKNVPLISGLISDHLNKTISLFSKELGFPWINLKELYSDYGRRPYWEQNMLTSLVAFDVMRGGVGTLKNVNPENLPAPQISPGRFEQMTLKNRRFIFIGAHNLDGLRQLVLSVFLRIEKTKDLKTLFSISKRPDQEVSSMMELLESCKFIKEDLTLCYFKHPKAMPTEKLLSLLKEREMKGKGIIKFAKDWSTEIQEDSKGTTLVLGSYYFIGEVQKHLLHLQSLSL